MLCFYTCILSFVTLAGGWIASAALVASLLTVFTAAFEVMDRSSVKPVLRYRSADLLAIRDKKCLCVKRKVVRKLKYFNIYLRHISTRITPREFDVKRPFPQRGKKCSDVLVPIRFVPKKTRRRKRSSQQPPPSIFLSNVRCIRNKMDEIVCKISELSPDIVLLCETWLNKEIPDSAVEISGYTSFRNDRNAYGGGIIAYFADFLKVVAVRCENILLETSETEFSVFVLPDVSLLLIALYHPVWNNKSKHEAAVNQIMDIIDFVMCSYLNPCNAKIILCGDFNDLRLFNDDIARLSGLTQIVDFPTRGDHTLDQIFTNMPVTNPVRVFSPMAKSDHKCIFWSHDSPKKHSIVKKVVRNMSKANLALFNSIVTDVDWQAYVCSFANIDDAFQNFLSVLRSIFDLCFPFRTIRLRPTDQPWVKPSLKLLIDERDRAFSKGHISKYCRLRTRVIDHIKFLKNVYLKNFLCQKDARQTWRAVHTVGRTKTSKSTIPAPLTAEDFSKFFASVSQSSVRQQYLSSDLPHVPLVLSVYEVQRSLSTMRRTSCAPDDVPAWVYRDMSHCLAPAVTHLFNRSFEEEYMPRCLKRAIIKPIPKCAKPSIVSDFRPISILPHLSKLLEKFVARYWIIPFIRSKIKKSQFAYLPGPGSGTSCALTLVYDRIVSFLDRPGAVRMLSLDFAKAFDKISHVIILEAATFFHLPISAVTWLSSFLSDRFQRVQVKDNFSQWSCVPSGVPQGSVLGPLLFCMVIDDFSCACPNSLCVKYADDVTILHFIRSADDDHIQNEWNNAVVWAERQQLPLNIDKCRIMNIVTKKNFQLSPVLVSPNNFLNNVSCIKFLGVSFTEDLKWNTHINDAVSKSSRQLYILYNLVKASCPSPVLWNVYNACLRSIMLYGCPALCNMPLYLQKKLMAVERRAIRIMRFQPSVSVLDAADAICRRLFATIEAHDDHPLRVLFAPRNPTPRNAKTLAMPKGKTKRYTSSFVRYAR